MTVIVRHLGCRPYVPTWQAMQAFTARRGEDDPDELWCLEHPPVFTLGLAGRPEHLRAPGDIPVIRVDRGGQVTYHGPGQIVIYCLIDLRRAGLGIRRLVTLLEQSVIALLESRRIDGYARSDAPGVYVAGRKIASLGLRVRRGCSYHGLAFNADMDLEPFGRIDPCGHPDLEVTQLRALSPGYELRTTAAELLECLVRRLGYRQVEPTSEFPFHPQSGAANARTESA